MAAATNQSPQIINIKWLHSSGDYRRFLLEVTDNVDIYELLLQKIRTVIPGFEGSLAWQDEDGDTIVFSSHIEMKEAIALPRNRDLFRIYTLEDAPKKSEKQEKKTGEEDASKKSDKHDKKNREEKKSGTKETHVGIICDKCDKQITGIRYKCTVCNDYDLCEKCERHGYHAEHPMVRYVTPVDRVNSSSSSRSSHSNSPQFMHLHCGGWGGGRGGGGRGGGRGGFYPHPPGFRTPFGTASVFTGFMPPPNVPAADMATRAADIAIAASQAATAAAQRATSTLLQNMMGPNHGPTYPTRPQQPQAQQPQAQQPQQQQQQQQQQTGGQQQQQQPQQPQQQPQQPQQQPQQTGGGQTQEDPSQQFRESFANGFDYLREIGQQVQQALSNFGIEVDMDIEHGDVREHVPRDSTQNNNNNNDNTSSGSARNGTTTTTTKAPEEAAAKKQQCENVTNEANEHIEQHQSTEEMEQQPNDVVASDGQQQNTETANTDITEPNVNEVVGVPLKRMHISEEAAMEEHELPLERSNLNVTNAEDADTAILVDIADDDGNTWTMMDNAETIVNNSNTATAAQPQVYPNLSDPGIRCMAGTPFIQAPQGPHNPHCSIIHADKRIASCVQQLESMGFDNCNGWLIKLAIENGGDTARVIEEAAKDPIYVQRLQSAL